MKPAQILLALAAVIAVVIAVVATGGGGGGASEKDAPAPSRAPAGALRVEFGYSPEKKALIEPLVERYNAEARVVGGKRVFVEATSVASGDAERRIAEGSYQPTAWSPAGSLWGRLLNFEADRELVADDNPSLVRTPLVIAMWKDQAEALGWPKRRIGFSDLERLAVGRGWESMGRPEFGEFKLVHTNPDYSTAGLEATVAEYYAATGKREGLRPSDISGPARERVRKLEESIIHYGDTTVFVADQLVEEGPSYASAAIMEEATLLDVNRRRRGDKMVALYPKEGTFYSDSPYAVLDAPWVDEAERDAAADFGRFLTESITPALAARAGFRPADLDVKPVAPITAANGVDPLQPTRVLGLPEPRVLDRIKRAWQEDRRAANVMIVLDVSGSMNDEGRLEQAVRGVEAFLTNVGKQDRIGLTVFSDVQRELAPIGTDRREIRRLVRGLRADGGTAVYDATVDAFSKLRSTDDRERINAVVVLTDGEDTDSTRTADDVVTAVRSQGDSPNQVRVFTIAYLSGPESEEVLAKIAEAAGGKPYVGSTETIDSVYRSISSFF